MHKRNFLVQVPPFWFSYPPPPQKSKQYINGILAFFTAMILQVYDIGLQIYCNILSLRYWVANILQYIRSTILGCKYIGIRTSEFVIKTYFVSRETRKGNSFHEPSLYKFCYVKQSLTFKYKRFTLFIKLSIYSNQKIYV